MTEEAKEARRAYTREYMRKWRKEHPEKLKSYARKWRKEHPDKVKEYNARHWEKKAAKQGARSDD